jgi:uncharacterized membrane protein YoaK (UPF0700 family)
MKKYFFGWENIKNFIKDIYETLSSKPSKLSSKRLERLALSISAISIIMGAFIYLMVEDKLTSGDAVMLSGTLFVAAGYNMSQTQKEKQKEIKDVAEN